MRKKLATNLHNGAKLAGWHRASPQAKLGLVTLDVLAHVDFGKLKIKKFTSHGIMIGYKNFF